ncbi:UNVERIFIED_CONTAM: hypothetical protein Slati_0188400 [Sesamum latifolium]|uniref:GAG-pre-integrase domain-containing protein n=1 Tax=Sesamum latifolium TaxID=2727402 RepID=A0AAW2YB77_9LAMI
MSWTALPTALPEGSSPEERVTFDKWLEDNRKVLSIILASMTNEIQKQYDRLEGCSLDNAPHERHFMQFLTGILDMPRQKRGFDLQGEGKGARLWKRKKGKGTAVTSTASTEGAPPAAPTGKGKGRLGVLSSQGQMMCAFIAMERGIGRGSIHNSSPTQSNLIMTAQHKRKVNNHENAQIWHARLGHISKDRTRRLVDSKSLEIDDLDHLPTCESCLKGKMINKPFVGQSAIANGLLDLVHTDVCGPLSVSARGGFSYFITFTMIIHGMVMFT